MTLLSLGMAICQSTTDGGAEADKIYQSLSQTKLVPPAVSSDTAKLELSKYPAISVLRGILYFASPEHVQAAQRYLEARAQEVLYKAYLKYGTTDIPDADIRSVNLNLGYEEFERQYAFTSLRQKVEKEVAGWSSQTDSPDPSLDPELAAVPEASLRTLLNVFSEINVGKVFYRVSPQGSQEYSTEAALVASRTTVATSSSSPAARLLQASFCNDPIFKSKTIVHPSGKFRIYTSVRHYCFLCLGILKNYRVEAYVRISRKVFGVWWPSIRPVYARAFGSVSSLTFLPSPPTIHRDLCQAPFAYNVPLQSQAWNVWSVTHMVRVNYRTKLGWTNGNLYGATGLSPNLIFVWPLNA